MRRVYLICINLFLRSHGPNPYIDFRVRKLSVSFNILRVCVCVCVCVCLRVSLCPYECIFHCLLRFFSFSGDNTLPKAPSDELILGTPNQTPPPGKPKELVVDKHEKAGEPGLEKDDLTLWLEPYASS